MDYIKGESREQITLLPDCIENYITSENAVRVIDAFVDSLEITAMGFKRAVNNSTGRPAYNPRDLLKLYIYGYLNGIRSGRKLMRECGRNVEVFYLINKLQPDFRTISDFRKDNAAALKKVFSAFTKLCLGMGLFGQELVAVDGTKIRAVNAKDNCYTPEVLKKKLATIEEKIERYMEALDKADQAEQETAPDGEAVKAALKALQARKGKYTGYLEALEQSGDTQLLTTDPEARRIHSKDGFHCGYNVQAAVDAKSHMIAAYEVTNKSGDMGLLLETTEQAREELGCESIAVTADKGYDSREDILNCVMNGIVPNVIPRYDKDEHVFQIEYEEREITEELRTSTKPADIQSCLHAGVLPEIYAGTNISVELQYPEKLSCFVKNEDGTVTCPTGKILTKVRTRGENSIYASKAACRSCLTRCKAGGNHKVVSFGPNTTFVPVKMYGAASNALTPIPEEGMSPYNHTLDRRDYIKPKTVLIRIRHDESITKQRKEIVEHPFGTVKRSLGATYTLLKGKTKGRADIGLCFLAYNMIRAINLVGVKRLIEAMGQGALFLCPKTRSKTPKTPWLREFSDKVWRALRDSNLWPLESESNALSN